MQRNGLLSKGLDSDIATVHQRFLAAMENRLPAMSLETKERYFVVLSSLVGKLEAEGKSVREVLREMMTEVAAYVFQEIGTPA
ncbi:MAG: hypothetical protein ACHQ9S_10085 [Candidatus Binatia bacterium]